jgi:hypothetical protein
VGERVSLYDRLKQQLSAAKSQREAREILLSAQEEVDTLPPRECERLPQNSTTWFASFLSDPNHEDRHGLSQQK